MKKLFTIIAALACVFYAHGFCVDGINYYYEGNNEVSVAGLCWDWDSPYPYNVVIPSSIKDDGVTYTVTSIDYQAFYNENFTSISIPKSVKYISDEAFYNCYNLTSITILGNNVDVSFNTNPFRGCNPMTSITMPEDIGDISHWNLRATKNGVEYQVLNGKEIELRSWETASGSVKIPENVVLGKQSFSVTSIGAAFRNCSGLTSIIIPSSVTEIGASAFNGCSGLTSITIPSSVTEIGASAFRNCSGLTSIIIPSSVTEIGASAFNGCSGLTSITIPSSVTYLGFADYESVSKYDFSKNKRFVEEGGVVYNKETGKTISYNTELPVITIPEGVVFDIKDFRYWDGDDCDFLLSYEGKLNLPDNIEYVYYREFLNCQKNEYEGCYYVGNDEHPYLYLLEVKDKTKSSYTIHDDCRVIAEYAFENCTSLRSIKLPAKVRQVGYRTFYGCSSLRELEILNESSELSLANDAFGGCSVLYKITCHSIEPYTIEDTFETYASDLYVTCDAIENYEYDALWGKFKNIQCFVEKYIVSVVANQNTYGSVIGSGEYEKNKTATLAAIPASGYHFVKWNDESTENPRTITITENAEYTAVFEEIVVEPVVFTVSVLANNNLYGTVAGSGSYEENAMATVKAVASEGYKFVKWSDGNSDNPRVITVTADVEYTAIFEMVSSSSEPTEFTVSVLSSDDAMGSVMGAGSYEKDATATLIAIPASGYNFVNWSDGNTENPRVITISENVEYVAEFAQASGNTESEYTITVVASDNSMGTIIGAGKYEVGAIAILAAVASKGYQFVQWNDGSNDNPRMVTVTENMFLVATFEKISTAIDKLESTNEISIVGRQIFVNGEAPEFVTTVLGQRIANKNLKSGIYFVQSGNKQIGVSVR